MLPIDDYPGSTVVPKLAAEAGTPFSDALDALAVLRASQALSSERNAAKLSDCVEKLMRTLTGASKVVLALWDEDANDWVMQRREGPAAEMRIETVAERVPLSALHHAASTAEPLLLVDAVADARFSRDPYFRSVERCSVMVVPILRQRVARAMLVLENRSKGGAFSAGRLEAVMMIAGQLAVALENAQLYKEVGIRLGLAEITVKSHLTAIFRLLGVVNRTQAVVTMRKLGLDYSAGVGERSSEPPPP